MQVQSLGQEDPLEEGMATHSSILAGRIPWTEEPDRPQSIGLQRVGGRSACTLHTSKWPKHMVQKTMKNILLYELKRKKVNLYFCLHVCEET